MQRGVQRGVQRAPDQRRCGRAAGRTALVIGLLMIVPALLPAADAESGKVGLIRTQADLDRVLTEAGERLVVLDLHADWCGPCKMIAPLLEEIAHEMPDRVSVFKINVDHSRDLARVFQVSGIPLVIFMRKGERVHALTGVRPKAAYVRDIERFSDSPPASRERPDGELVGGVRVIQIGPATWPGELYVYRGETVKLIFEASGLPFAVSIPGLQAQAEGTGAASVELTFKAVEVGTFEMFCNGRCPSGEGERRGVIVVVPFTTDGQARFSDLGTEEARKLLASGRALVLDVRTPNEFYSGHIDASRMIPLDQLEARLSEIEAHRTQPILLVCAHGDRSTVAAEILIRNGFTELYNLRHGVVDWARRGYPLVS